MVIFFSVLELGSLSAHSGYNLPWNYNALQHDWHQCAEPAFSPVTVGRLTDLPLRSYIYTENFGPNGPFCPLRCSSTD